MISRHRARSYRACPGGRQYPGFLVVQPVADGALNRGPIDGPHALQERSTGGLDPDDLAPAVSGAGLAAHKASVSNRSISRDTLCWAIRRRCSTFAFGNYPWPLALDVERAFHPCNISSKETNDRGDEAGAAKILIDPFLSDNPSWDKGWIGSRAGKDSTRGGGR